MLNSYTDHYNDHYKYICYTLQMTALSKVLAFLFLLQYFSSTSKDGFLQKYQNILQGGLKSFHRVEFTL